MSPLSGRQPGALSEQIIQLDVLKCACDLERKIAEVRGFKTRGGSVCVCVCTCVGLRVVRIKEDKGFPLNAKAWKLQAHM